jgi:two-component system, chemotaxis family, chemotaxis protein CheY
MGSTSSRQRLKRTGEFAAVESSGARPAVLVLEDDGAISDAVRDVLEEAGFAVTCVHDGQRGLEHLEENAVPAVILTDLMMPGMDGWTFLDRVRSTAHLRQVPVVVMTAAGPHWGYPAGARVLLKPMEAEDLVGAVRAAIFGDSVLVANC